MIGDSQFAVVMVHVMDGHGWTLAMTIAMMHAVGMHPGKGRALFWVEFSSAARMLSATYFGCVEPSGAIRYSTASTLQGSAGRMLPPLDPGGDKREDEEGTAPESNAGDEGGL